MSYGISLSDEAIADLAKLPIPVRRFAILQLELLAAIPTSLSRRSRFPYREACQLFHFDLDVDLQRWEMTALFQYGQDEQTIHILAVGVARRDLGDGVDV